MRRIGDLEEIHHAFMVIYTLLGVEKNIDISKKTTQITKTLTPTLIKGRASDLTNFSLVQKLSHAHIPVNIALI